jgi:hypothetical protein
LLCGLFDVNLTRITSLLAACLAAGAVATTSLPAQAAVADSSIAPVRFRATGGTVTREGLFTAGSIPGSFRVIASSETAVDTATVTVVGPASAEPSRGIPFGPFDAWDAGGLKPNTQVFTATIGSTNPSNILERIAVARAKGIKLILTMTGGAHQNYLSFGTFDMAKWQARMDAYNTPAITSGVSAAVADETIIGNSVMDEPHVSGQGDGNTWGPRGTMTKARVDQLCAYVKGIFPTLPVGVVHPHQAFEPDQSYHVCDFMVDQYSWRQGDVTKFRDDGLALARRDGMAIAFSMNILNGGIQAKRNGAWDCPAGTTEGRGTHKPNCRMTAAQVREWGVLLGSAGCAFVLWRYDDVYMSDPENQRAFTDVANVLAIRPANPCRRK